MGARRDAQDRHEGRQAALDVAARAPDAALCYPQSGRSGELPVHGGIGWSLAPGDVKESDAVDTVLDEAAASPHATACISWEGFHLMHARPDALVRLRDAARAHGFAPRILLYVRPQAEYLESLYPQLLFSYRFFRQSFAATLEAVLASGEIAHQSEVRVVRYAFDYARVVDAFAGVFGRDAIVVRRFDASLPRDRHVRDAFATMGLRVPAAWDVETELNRRPTLGRVLELMRERAGTDARVAFDERIAAAPFRPLRTRDLARIALRFAAGNRRVRARYGARVAPVSSRRLQESLLADAGLAPLARAARATVARADRAWFGADAAARGSVPAHRGST